MLPKMEMKFYLILLFFLLHLTSASSPSSLLGRENFPSGVEVHGTSGSPGAEDDGKNRMTPSSKMGPVSNSKFRGVPGGGSAHNRNDGRSASNREKGGSRSPEGQGGAAVVPIYVAGAANKHNKHHHGTAHRNCICIGLSLSSTALALAVTQPYI